MYNLYWIFRLFFLRGIGVYWGMFAKVESMGVYALKGFRVTVEVDISRGLPQFELVGLPDSAVKESRDRVRSAIKNLGFEFPVSRITLNLAPADLRKTGPVYDLPILLGLLSASGQIPPLSESAAFAGELSLDGSIRPVQGALTMALAARECGISELFLPAENAAEAAVLPELRVYALKTVSELLQHLTNAHLLSPMEYTPFESLISHCGLDLSDVHGQPEARRALEIAASGGHNLLFIGAPGSGKSMLAKRLPGILPPLTQAESMETTQIYSVAGKLDAGSRLLTVRPFRSPHHTVSSTALTGGGAIPRPGEVSLAHNGVLFLDELPEFQRSALEILRQPLEDGKIVISRAAGQATFPCNMMLVAAMNPCPCGYLGHPTRSCSCTPSAVDRYRSRISGPLLDRIDLHVNVEPVDYESLSSMHGGESSETVRKRVIAARQIQHKRLASAGISCNADIPDSHLRSLCQTTPSATRMLATAFDRLGLSARAYSRILKVARTIADMAQSEKIEEPHIGEALQYRTLDRNVTYHF